VAQQLRFEVAAPQLCGRGREVYALADAAWSVLDGSFDALDGVRRHDYVDRIGICEGVNLIEEVAQRVGAVIDITRRKDEIDVVHHDDGRLQQTGEVEG
jgi:hypothetical protein